MTINDTNIATVEWIDEHYWNSLFRNRYWLEAEEIDCLVDVVVKVARAASCEGSEPSNAIDMPRVLHSMGQSPIEKRSFWQDAKIHDIGTTIFLRPDFYRVFPRQEKKVAEAFIEYVKQFTKTNASC